MIKKELLKLTPQERDVIILWRLLSYPKVLSIQEISKVTPHSEVFIKETICKFNRNCRLKLETYEQEKNLKASLEFFFCET